MIDVFKMAVRSLRAHLLRSLLTLVGIVIGITAVVGMSSLIRGVDEVIVGGIRAMNPHVVYLTKFPMMVTSHEQWRKLMKRPDITTEDIRTIEDGCPSVGKLDLFIEANTNLARGKQRTKNMSVIGVGENYLDVNSMIIKSGRYFAAGEVTTAARVIVLAKDPVETLFGDMDPVGKTVRLQKQEYMVVGVFQSQAEGGGFNIGQDNFCAIPYTSHQRDVTRRRQSLMLAMVPREGVALERMMEEVSTAMRMRHRLRASQEDDFDMITQESILKLWRDISSAIFLGLIGISSIALLVGGIGVMAIMMVSVTERTREIGIRRAVGATRGRILAQFLIEAALLTAAGGLLGSGIGAASAWGLAKAVGLPVATPWDTFALAVGVSALIGLVFGVVPAYRAARMDVVEALRCE